MHVWPAIDWLISTGRAGPGRPAACILVSSSVHVLIGGRQPAGACSRNKVDERMNSGRPVAASNNLYAGDGGREYHAGVPAGGRSYVVAGPAGGHGHWRQLHT